MEVLKGDVDSFSYFLLIFSYFIFQMVCRAAYDYVAADDDEVSFNEGDFVIFCQPIDAGWMEGTVEATGRRGMLPSNYVATVKK